MFNSFRRKLTVSYLALIILLLIIAGGLVFTSFRQYYLHNLETRLTREAYLIADMVAYAESNHNQRMQELADTASRDNATRVSIIDRDGVVLGDSQFDSTQMEIHKSRPEVYQALRGEVGVAMRYSTTEKVKLLYVAVPQASGGVVRIAMPLAELTAINKHILFNLFLVLLISAVLAAILSSLMAKKFSGPLDDITDVIKEMADGNLTRRVSYQGIDELSILAESYNRMADSIEQGINEISEVKNRLEALLENSVNGILMVGGDGRISYINPVAISLLGLQENVIGRNKNEVINDYEIIAAIDRARKDLQPVRQEKVLHILGGKTVEMNIVPILSEDEAFQGILVILNDISELKRLEQVRKDFVANVSHELKTPLAAISGFAETLLDEEGEKSNHVSEFSRIIFDETQRLNRLVNGLLELSRMESEKMELNVLPVDIGEVVQNTLNAVQQQHQSVNICFDYIPPPAGIVIDSDPVLISQVLSNLLDNAIKYSPKGGRIQVEVLDYADRVEINVVDQGIGIPSQEIPRIFERFYRVDKARTRKTGGTGLGLAIAKHLLENLGGQISVQSTVAQGSKFTCTLFK
ncbi:Signal transduction histidine kinase, core [Syntrophomonas zehnderi OL-4]|uniref:histidine kinase n=1 Tax=Syntrophomonas zehnderi OL-4 TaxID=690567 RepID=A0A0E3W368_9FIRM|nr:ATP-binding protein [Syntrophomonas zehnderi]CFX54497.1 Signal transduction histidine kinase, core [Syntrophomonas zehnderi OL-4]